MFTHVALGANDIEQSKTFYDATLGALGVPPGTLYGDRFFYATETGMFMVTKPINGDAACLANGGTIGFAAKSPEEVDAWHAAGVAAGGVSCESPPGVRDMGAVKLYAAYLRDPVGNKLCASFRM